MKLVHLAGGLVCTAFLGLGLTLGGGNGMILVVVSLLGALYFVSRLLAPAQWSDGVEGNAVEDRRFLQRLVFQAFFIRVAASLLVHIVSFGGVPLWEYLGGDEGTFDGNARVFALWANGELPIMFATHTLAKGEFGYPILVGAMYSTFGVSKLIPLFVNCVVGACTVYPIHALAGRYAGRTAARRAAWLVAFFPSLVLWSSLMVRDGWVLFFLAAALYFADRLRRAIRAADVAGLLLCLACLVTLRTYVALIIGTAVAAGMVLGNRSGPRAIVAGGIAMLGLVLALRQGLGADVTDVSLERLAMLRRYGAMGPSVAGSLGTDVDISTPTAAITYLPLGLLYFYFSPLPWQIGSPRQVVALVDLVLWYSLMPAIVGGLFWMGRRNLRALLPLLFTVVGISVLYALVEGNIGIIFRHRAQIIVPLCIVAGVGYAVKRRAARKESRRLEGPVPLDAPARGALRPAPGLRVPARA